LYRVRICFPFFPLIVGYVLVRAPT